MKITKVILSSILLVSSLTATDILTQINFENDSEGNMNPNIFVPIYWNDALYSGIGYKSSTSKEIGTLDNFKTSKNGAVATKNVIKINWITKNFNNYSIGIQTNSYKISRNEFGYIHDSDNLFGNGSDYWIAFDNDLELDILQTGMYLDYSRKVNDMDIRLSGTISPSTTVKLKQSSIFKPLINDNGTSTSSSSQDLSYGLKFEAYYDTTKFIKLGLETSYNFNPYKYDSVQLSHDGTNYIFETNPMDTEETTTKYLFKAYINKKVMGELSPMIGFGKITVDNKDNKTNKTTTEENDIISIGFERRF